MLALGSRNGWSALHDCADFGQLKACTVLVDRHANLDVVDDYGGTPVQHSAEKGPSRSSPGL